MDGLSLGILKIYNARPKLSLIELGAIMNRSNLDLAPYVQRLRDRSYLCVASQDNGEIGPHTPFAITIDGKEFLEDYAREETRLRRVETRSRINTAISLAAVLIALIALLAQLGSILLQQPQVP